LTGWVSPNAPTNRYTTRVFLDLVTEFDDQNPDPCPELFLTRRAKDFADDFFCKHDLKGQKVLAVFAGGGHNPVETIGAKCLPLETFGKVIDHLILHIGLKVVLIGGPSDRERIDQLKKIVHSPCLDICGQTDLLETAAVIERVSLLITNDSAPLHMAVALSTPTISFFGPTSARSLVPNNSLHIILQSPLRCSPCYNFSRFPKCSDPRCLNEIMPGDIVDRALQLLSLKGSLGN
jgi:ADP-heptose:LPS heptosyltransferase